MIFEDMHILVAEDHGFQRKALIRMLRGLGAKHITEAEDGIAALSACRQPGGVDILILDLEMPGMDGMELIRHLAEGRSQARVIVASALDKALLASVETMARAYGVHFLGRVDKPVTPAKLSALLGVHAPNRPKGPARSFTEHDVAAGLQHREFTAFYQPKAALADGQVVGVEALARWQHPQHGTLAPASFIELVERHGMVEELTWQVLAHAAQAWRQWALQGHIVKVSVNLSLLALRQPGYAARIIEAVAAHGVDSRYIIFEITESSEMADVPHCLENLTRLRMHGFSLSIDDYGTGYASIQQLLRVPFSELKIDRSFVSAAATDETRLTVLASSLQLAQRLGLVAVAEGVETIADWKLLASLGCRLAQGYLISRPVPAAQLPAAIRHWEESYARLHSAVT